MARANSPLGMAGPPAPSECSHLLGEQGERLSSFTHSSVVKSWFYFHENKNEFQDQRFPVRAPGTKCAV